MNLNNLVSIALIGLNTTLLIRISMEKMKSLIVILILTAGSFSKAYGHSSGVQVTVTVCDTMKPGSTHTLFDQTTAFPYKISPEKLTYSAGDTIRGILISILEI